MSRADSTTPTSGTSRGSYPSRQRRFGPAPLASFEDLPTDEAHSSSSSSSDDEKAALSSVRMACPQISLIITDHNEVEHPIETVHLPEYDRRRLHSATAATLNISDGKSGEPKRKGSWTDIFSLGRSPTPTKARERKFSLFNFNFFSREVSKQADAQSDCELQSLVIASQPVTQRNEFSPPANVEHDIGVRLTDYEDNDEPEEQCLTPVNSSQQQYEQYEQEQMHRRQLQTLDYDITPTNVEPPSLSLVETVVQIELPQHPQETGGAEDNQTDVDSVSLCSGSSCSCSMADRDRSCCSETDGDALSCEECERIERSLALAPPAPCSCDELDTDAADNEDNDEDQPEDQQGSRHQDMTASDTDELESLLTGDELELNSAANAELQLPFTATDHHQQLPPRNTSQLPLLSCPAASSESESGQLSSPKLSGSERLKTSPIERPRSITPVNVSSFEAYIKCPPTENVSDCDRLTVTIPGLHPNQRNRFTRKSNPYIWADFCEKLKSPKIESRKRANSCFPEIANNNNNNTNNNNQNCYLNEAFSPSENLTPITPIKDIDGAEDRFDDNFWDYLHRNNHMINSADSSKPMGNGSAETVKAALSSLRKLQSSCSCECNSSVTSTTVYNFTTNCSEMSSYSEGSDNNEPAGEPNSSSISISISGRSAPTEQSSASVRTEFHAGEDQPLMSPCDCVCHRPGGDHSLAQFSFAELSTTTTNNSAGCCSSNLPVSSSTTTEATTPADCCTSAGASASASTSAAAAEAAALALYGNTEDDEISSQLSSSTLSSSTPTSSSSSACSTTGGGGTSTSQSVRLLQDTSATT